jgi:hypothetical protein
MGLLKFDVKNWHELDNGRLARAVEQAIRKIVADCIDRPGLDSARKLGLTLTFKPFADDLGDVVAVNLDFEVKTSVPSTGREGLSLGVQKNGDLIFNTSAPDNVAQSTIFDGDEVEKNGPNGE